MFNPLKTLVKVGKSLGLLAVVGAAAALSPEAVTVVAAPLGPFAPLVAIGVAAGMQAISDWYKHRTKPVPETVN